MALKLLGRVALCSSQLWAAVAHHSPAWRPLIYSIQVRVVYVTYVCTFRQLRHRKYICMYVREWPRSSRSRTGRWRAVIGDILTILYTRRTTYSTLRPGLFPPGLAGLSTVRGTASTTINYSGSKPRLHMLPSCSQQLGTRPACVELLK